MYSSNSNPFPQLTKGNVFLPPSLFPHHNTLHEIFHRYPHNNQLQDLFFPFENNTNPCPFIIDNAAAAANNASATLNCDDPLGYLIANKKSRAMKDRHSMIFTAQGFRHRRVRLSIDIARKFFNLQDMLGLDKASQTLDWLFTNSKTAIQQLVEINNYNLLPNSSPSASECDELETLSQTKKATAELIIEGSRRMRNSKIHGTGNEKKTSRAPAVDHLIAKVSREKARTRARERTQEKQRIRKLDEEFKKRIPHHNRSIRSSSENVMSAALPFSGVSLVNDTPWKDIIVEAILTKKPLKTPPIYFYQQNMPVPEEIKFQSQIFSQYKEKSSNGKQC